MKNRYTVTWSLVRHWYTKTMFRGTKLFALLFFCALALLGICGGLFLLLILPRISPNAGNVTGEAILLFGIALFCIYRAFFNGLVMLRQRFNYLAKSYGSKEWISSSEFEEEKIRLKEGTFQLTYRYTDITEIQKEGNEVTLLLRNKSTLHLYTDCFEGGTWEECLQFLREKNPDIIFPE